MQFRLASRLCSLVRHIVFLRAFLVSAGKNDADSGVKPSPALAASRVVPSTLLVLTLLFTLLPSVSRGDNSRGDNSQGDSGSRTFEFGYEIESENLPTDQQIDIYIPIPPNTPFQEVSNQNIVPTHSGREGQEQKYGNRYFHTQRKAGDRRPIKLSASWRVKRQPAQAYEEGTQPLDQPANFLGANARVPIGHPILEPILKEVYAKRESATAFGTARAIYDWVVDNVEYKKVGTGWGNGDTFWACNERYGNCTDFHSLFISLARSEQIPSRFEIGFPVPTDRGHGDIAGYHCWVQFYLPGQGRIPIDASEAFKHPERREQYFGAHPADRIHFSTGRDLSLSKATQDQPLNYFVYPHVEIDGEISVTKLSTRFWYRDESARKDVVVSQERARVLQVVAH